MKSVQIVDTPDGRMSVRDAAKHYKIRIDTLRRRIHKLPQEQWFYTGKLLHNNPKPKLFIDTPAGKMSIAQAAKHFGLCKATLWARVRDHPQEKWFLPVRKEDAVFLKGG